MLRSSCILNECNLYVIGLHAVQFGHNWMTKIPRTAKIGRGRKPSPIWLSEEFFEFNYFQVGACQDAKYCTLEPKKTHSKI